jgi:membrane protease YdiL (CAAX protease family)
MTDRLTQSPALVRVLPFAVFIALTFIQDSAGEAGRYWIYLGKTLAGAAVLFALRKYISELEWRFSIPALVTGIVVFIMWVGIDGWYPTTTDLYSNYICPALKKIGLAKTCEGAAARSWNPNATFGDGSPLSIFFILVRIAGATLLVPAIEEIFWRSFVYRFAANVSFDRETLGRFFPGAFIITAVLFGFEHREWLAGILCACAYQGLVIWKKRLGDAVVAHAITNFLLGLYVVWKGAWQFW